MTHEGPTQPGAMSTLEFQVLRDLVHRETGIALGPHKRTLLEARLSKRLRALALPSFSAYHAWLQHHDPTGEEHRRFVNAVTTNCLLYTSPSPTRRS